MKRQSTQKDYTNRINRVIDYIHDNLDNDLDIEKLAEVACFSPYHWHRIYRHMTGETPAQTVRRLRLHRAAHALVKSELAVSIIATKAGYSKTEAFSRSFSSVYGSPPIAYRRKGQHRPSLPFSLKEDLSMYKVAITEQPGLHLAAVTHKGPYDNFSKVFEKLLAWGVGNGKVDESSRFFAIYYNDPGSTKSENLHSEAAFTIDEAFKGNDIVHAVDFPAGKIASITHKGPYTELETAYSWLFGHWLPQSGEEAADRPVFEEYLNDCRSIPPSEWLTQINLPLR